MRAAEIARLLPFIVRRTLSDFDGSDTPLAVMLRLMEKLHAPAEARLENLADYFHPYDAPDEFVYYLASWLDLAPLFTERVTDIPDDYFFAGGLGRLRELNAAAVRLANRRGTHTGLRRFLEIATGLEGYQIVEDDERPFHIRITCPAAVDEQPGMRALIEEIVEIEKPVYVTYDLTVAPPVSGAVVTET